MRERQLLKCCHRHRPQSDKSWIIRAPGVSHSSLCLGLGLRRPCVEEHRQRISRRIRAWEFNKIWLYQASMAQPRVTMPVRIQIRAINSSWCHQNPLMSLDSAADFFKGTHRDWNTRRKKMLRRTWNREMLPLRLLRPKLQLPGILETATHKNHCIPRRPSSKGYKMLRGTMPQSTESNNCRTHRLLKHQRPARSLARLSELLSTTNKFLSTKKLIALRSLPFWCWHQYVVLRKSSQ